MASTSELCVLVIFTTLLLESSKGDGELLVNVTFIGYGAPKGKETMKLMGACGNDVWGQLAKTSINPDRDWSVSVELNKDCQVYEWKWRAGDSNDNYEFPGKGEESNRKLNFTEYTTDKVVFTRFNTRHEKIEKVYHVPFVLMQSPDTNPSALYTVCGRYNDNYLNYDGEWICNKDAKPLSNGRVIIRRILYKNSSFSWKWKNLNLTHDNGKIDHHEGNERRSSRHFSVGDNNCLEGYSRYPGDTYWNMKSPEPACGNNSFFLSLSTASTTTIAPSTSQGTVTLSSSIVSSNTSPFHNQQTSTLQMSSLSSTYAGKTSLTSHSMPISVSTITVYNTTQLGSSPLSNNHSYAGIVLSTIVTPSAKTNTTYVRGVIYTVNASEKKDLESERLYIIIGVCCAVALAIVVMAIVGVRIHRTRNKTEGKSLQDLEPYIAVTPGDNANNQSLSPQAFAMVDIADTPNPLYDSAGESQSMQQDHPIESEYALADAYAIIDDVNPGHQMKVNPLYVVSNPVYKPTGATANASSITGNGGADITDVYSEIKK